MLYRRVSDESELLAALAQPGATVLAGGTDLLVKLRAGMLRPEVLVDIGRIPTLRGIRTTAGIVEIGAAEPEADILASTLVQRRLPLLATALAHLGSVQIRNRGTLGGNLVNASPAADTAVPLLVYGAALDLVSPEGARTIELERFLLGPGTTALRHGEIVRTVRIPIPEQKGEIFYHKVGKRRALTIAIASLGGWLRIERGTILEARLAAGSVAPTPLRLRAVEERLRGAAVTDDLIEEARRLTIDTVVPIDDVRSTAAYRAQVVADLVMRMLRSAKA